MTFDVFFRVALVGASGAGKTSLINRYVDNIFIPRTTTTVGIDYKTKDVEIEDSTFRLQIWDTAGQEKFRIPLSSSIYKNAEAFIIVFDLTVEESLESVDYYFSEIDKISYKNPLIILVGNKCDLIENQIENVEEKLEEIAKGKEFKLFKTSAKEGTNVNELFYYIAKTLKENQPKQDQSVDNSNTNPTNNPQTIKLTESQTPKKVNKCC
ncbi:ras-related protein rab-3a [Anaeramoeba ignava]|uniref:Ras-related protein rab-3a n=1 Tax=Anaeramoeba ignava TaxID=1746090 RepID=A0A9Q0LSN2_ANAIG|nr:ras-related protein rab-3a [Anaeramoeba ignava]